MDQSLNQVPFTVVKGNQSTDKLDKRNFEDFECRESGMSIDDANKQQFKNTVSQKKEQKYQKKQEAKLQNEYQFDMNNKSIPNQFQNTKSSSSSSSKKTPQEYQRLYDQENFKYVNESFTVQSNYYIKKIASEEKASDIACQYPLYKMIRSIVKKFLFNELEIIFFAYILEENKWQMNDENLKRSAFNMKDFLNITEVKEPLQYKTVLLYLVLNAYAVKYYLNDNSVLEMFKYHIEVFVPNFKEIFSSWSKKFAQNSLKVNPKMLNKVFKNLSEKPTDYKKEKQEDYNSLVDAIIQISPPYNNDKAEAKEKQEKQEESQKQEEAQHFQPNPKKKQVKQQQQPTQIPQMQPNPYQLTGSEIPDLKSNPSMFSTFFMGENNTDNRKYDLGLVKNVSMNSEGGFGNMIEDTLKDKKMLNSNQFNSVLGQNNSFFGQQSFFGSDLNNLNLMQMQSQQYQNQIPEKDTDKKNNQPEIPIKNENQSKIEEGEENAEDEDIKNLGAAPQLQTGMSLGLFN